MRKVGLNNNAVRDVWNRAHIKVLKLAALVAVGVNSSNPMIKVGYLEWAKGLVTHEVTSLVGRLERGDVGAALLSSDEGKQIKDIASWCWKYLTMPTSKLPQSRNVKDIWHSAKMIPQSFLTVRASNLNSFKTDRLGPTRACERAIAFLIGAEILHPVNTKSAEFNRMFEGVTTNAKLFTCVDIPALKRAADIKDGD